MTGYLHADYAASLSEFGMPIQLAESGGWILKRSVPGQDSFDGMGPYPLFCCRSWDLLWKDLDQLQTDLISLSIVADPLKSLPQKNLESIFPDLVKPFKTHYIVNTENKLTDFISSHHKRYSKKSFNHTTIQKCEQPIDYLEDWINLYQELIDLHGISGIRKFSRKTFERQMTIPGLSVFRAVADSDTVAMSLWFEQVDCAYFHLSASNKLGYEYWASFGMFWEALNYFQKRVHWIDLGGGAGLVDGDLDGLARFKQGWSNETRTAYLCGKIFDHERYNELAITLGKKESSYFPKYREGEFK